MNILFCSVPFRPSVGGIETVSALLAERFQRQGHRVVLVTRSPSVAPDSECFEVVRQPSAQRLFSLVRWADVVFHNNISLRFAWPLLLLRRPWVVAHHTWIPRRGWAARLKRWVMPQARHIAVSQAVADTVAAACTVVPNPYADDVFVRIDGMARERELVFVGRLVSDKGVDLLINALALLARRGRYVRLTVVGDGPERESLQRQAQALNLADRIEFVGHRAGSDLAQTLNAHRLLVVPSVWEEPFGVVVLEAMACGCVPLVTQSGGLPEAVGACGVVLARSARESLAAVLAAGIDALLNDHEAIDHYREKAASHLERHTPDRVARDYLQVITDACRVAATPSTARAG